MDHLRAVMRDRPSEMHHRGLLGPRSSVGWLDVAMDLSAAPGFDAGAGVLDSLVSTLARGALGGNLLSRRNSSFNFGDMLGDVACPRVPSALASYAYKPLPAVSTTRLDPDELPELSPASDAPDDAFFPHDHDHDHDLAPPPPPLLSATAASLAEPQKATKKKVYQCHSCPKTYGTSEGLRLHVRGKHTNDKNSKCAHCDRSFVRASDLKLHVLRMHESSRPFGCEHWSVSLAPRAPRADAPVPLAPSRLRASPSSADTSTCTSV